MKVTVDSNILVYTADRREPARQRSSIAMVDAIGRAGGILTLQAVGEFLHVTVRKRITTPEHACARVDELLRAFPPPAAASVAALATARRFWMAHRFGFWDALLLATAASAGCAAIISEDMAPGAELDGLRVVGAFDPTGAIAPAVRDLLGLG